METTGSKLTDRPDQDLVKLALEQNQAAFIVLYTRYNAGVKSHISRYVAQKEDIEENLYSELYVAIWLNAF